MPFLFASAPQKALSLGRGWHEVPGVGKCSHLSGLLPAAPPQGGALSAPLIEHVGGDAYIAPTGNRMKRADVGIGPYEHDCISDSLSAPGWIWR